MAVRRMLISIGDDLCAGKVPSSSLASGYISLLGVRTDDKTWNRQTQAWENYSAGTNSYTDQPGFSYFGPEVSIRSAVDTQAVFAPGEVLWQFKYGIFGTSLLKWNDSLTATGSSNPGGVNHASYWPPARETPYTGLIANLTTAFAAAKSGGNSITIEGLVVYLGVWDAFAPAGVDAYPHLLRSFIAQLRADLAAINGLSVGAYAALPVTLVKPHDRFTASSAVQARLQIVRAAIETAGERVVLTDGLLSDGFNPTMASLIETGRRVATSVFSAAEAGATDAPPEPGDPIDLIILAGDSHAEGFGEIAALPAYMAGIGGFTGVEIWNPNSASGPRFETLTMNVNNLTTEDQITYPALNRYGPEFSLGEAAREEYRRTPRIVKLGMRGSWVAKSEIPSIFSADYPFYDAQCNDWNPASRGELFDKLIPGWATDALNALVATYGLDRIRLRRIVFMGGTNDSSVQDGGLQAREVQASVTSLISRIRRWAENAGIAWADAPVPATLVLPDSRYATYPLPEIHVGVVRSGLLAVAQDLPSVTTVDPSNKISFCPDQLHYNGAGNLWLGKTIWAAAGEPSVSVTPLFVPTRTQLVKALRLKGVPDAENAQDVIDEAISLVRTNIFQRLGSDRIATIRAISYSRTPTSDQDYLRLLAATTETKWVRVELMRVMPMQFVDGSAADQTWQNEAAFRAATFATIAAEAKRIRNEIDQALEILSGSFEIGADQSLKIKLIEATGTPDAPGDSIRIQGGAF